MLRTLVGSIRSVASHPRKSTILLTLNILLTFNARTGYKDCHLCWTFNQKWLLLCDMPFYHRYGLCTKTTAAPPAIEHPMFHEHSVVRTKEAPLMDPCKICKSRIDEGYPYECLTSLAKMFSTWTASIKNAEKTCILCGIESEHVFYHCSKCNFSICIYCKRNPPPLTVEHTKTHMHKLSLLSRRVSFTCNVCGMLGDQCGMESSSKGSLKKKLFLRSRWWVIT
ncbi:hypothetical protein Bca101_065049 [Brassica carinata]